MPPFKDEHVLIIAPGSQITAAQLGLPESFTPPRYRFPTRMFPGANPGEWEPVKIRTKISTKPKVVEAEPAPAPTPPDPEPIEVDSKPDVPITNGKEEETKQASGGQVNGEEAKSEQTNGEILKTEQSREGPQPKAEESAEEQPKGEERKDQPASSEDVEMKEAPPAEEPTKPETQDAEMVPPPEQEAQTTTQQQEEGEEEEEEEGEGEAAAAVEDETTETFEDDHWSTEGAVYPIKEGHIENWSCFFALLSHIYNMISPPFHMPVLFVAQPCWTARDHEMITQYVFEHWKIPAFCLMDAALTACYAYGVPTALVLDIGHEKCDVSAVTEFQVNDIGRGIALSGCGGRAMTKRLQQALESQGFDEDMAEQLKKSPICEILPAGIPYPRSSFSGTAATAVNSAAATSTGALDSGMNAKDGEGLRPGQVPRGPGMGTVVGEEGPNGDDEDNEGVLDVAAIVARDNAAEVLAKREREKAEKAAAKRGGAAEAARQIRLRNSERERATFTYVDFVPVGESNDADQPISRKRKREIEVGVERFMAVTPPPGACDGIVDIIAEAIHHTILSVPDIPQRATLWDNLIVLGNGSRIRGFTTNLLSVLNSRYILSPSTATIFTSELPSNFTTPVATPGTNTPIPGQGNHPFHHPGGGVNPLLVAATKNMMQPNTQSQHLQVPGVNPSLGGTPSADPSNPMSTLSHQHRGFSQSPISIKLVKPPEYFPEWKNPAMSGMEEAGFLGAQVAAKVVFIVDQGNSKGFLSRSEYNELGPGGIHECAM
ncbi:uncharacterized protein Z519_04179 [Cladophialophora bantiana CBS 173.52]|uniref:Chromatin remodeling complex subunit n=1 Tax=Cladophialophora bantiana (strain ATCC 10958 / CBS 173.52 / CDC B-1940 / NIH 8579) TaxID=1442370 RepID=A0A0D2IFQ3_CLAB1|nr:uncharacterized protein Z519_04179 [Cladophialophora bantiana CBS 173.52]KIW95594.1 hypothetical protein Z519_04179 [Cladophialophora bantiana CBS 173.52]